jgi:hypothetical protein
MRRTIALAGVLLIIAAAAFGQQESWGLFALGSQRAHVASQETRDTPPVRIGVVGVSAYRFRIERNAGWFTDATMFGPLAPVSVGGTTDVVDVPITVSMILGLGLRYDLAESFSLRGGIGPNVGVSVDPEGDTGYLLGFGGDLGAKVDLGSALHFAAGTLLRYDFLRFGVDDAPSVFTVRPYVGLGINLVIEDNQSRLGSP